MSYRTPTPNSLIFRMAVQALVRHDHATVLALGFRIVPGPDGLDSLVPRYTQPGRRR